MVRVRTVVKAGAATGVALAAAGGLVAADYFLGDNFSIRGVAKEVFHWFNNNRLLATGVTLGTVGASAAVYDAITTARRHAARRPAGAAAPAAPDRGGFRSVYSLALVAAAGSLIAMYWIGHPVGIKGKRAEVERPPVVDTRPVTRSGLDEYLQGTIIPKIKEEVQAGKLSMSDLDSVVAKGIQVYANTQQSTDAAQEAAWKSYANEAVNKALAQAGYASASDVTTASAAAAAANKSVVAANGKISNLESTVIAQATQLDAQAAQNAAYGTKIDKLQKDLAALGLIVADKAPSATATPQATATPANVTAAGKLEEYLQKTGYEVPVEVLRGIDLSGELSIPSDLYKRLTDTDLANREFVKLVVTAAAVKAVTDNPTGQSTLNLKQTNSAALTTALQQKLSADQLAKVTQYTPPQSK